MHLNIKEEKSIRDQYIWGSHPCHRCENTKIPIGTFKFTKVSFSFYFLKDSEHITKSECVFFNWIF